MDGIERFFDDQLTQSQIDLLQNSPPTRTFAIISWGCTATSWIAKALDSHPDVFCVHALNSVWSELGSAPRLDGLPYLRLLASYGYAYKIAGDIHGVSRTCVPELKRALGDRFGMAVIVREPIARLRSQISLFEQCDYRGWGDLANIDPIARRLGIDPASLSVPQRHFIHGASMLNEILGERKIARIFRTEDLTTQPDALLELVAEISSGTLIPSRVWAEQAIGMAAVNRHSGGKRPFDGWEREVLQAVVLPEAWHAYQELGYVQTAIES